MWVSYKLLSEEPADALKEKCRFMNAHNLLAVAVDAFNKGEPLSDFEAEADGYALSLLKKKKYSVDGIIPFTLYCHYKLAELKNVRIIMVGLINGVDKNEIKRRLRETYEG